MRPLDETYTVAMPWYEESEFAELWALAHDREQMPPDYSVWLRNATQAMKNMLARGRAVQVVTIRLGPYHAWLATRSLQCTAATRRRYVEELVVGGSAAFDGGGAAIALTTTASRAGETYSN